MINLICINCLKVSQAPIVSFEILLNTAIPCCYSMSRPLSFTAAFGALPFSKQVYIRGMQAIPAVLLLILVLASQATAQQRVLTYRRQHMSVSSGQSCFLRPSCF